MQFNDLCGAPFLASLRTGISRMRSGSSTVAELAARMRRAFAGARKRLADDKRGVTSIEFAIISIPIVGLFTAIAGAGISQLSQQVLDSALRNASRAIMTGQAQNAGLVAAQFKADLCSRVTGLINCSSGIHVDVKSYSTAAPRPHKPIKDGVFDPSDFGFSPGGPSCIVVVKAALEYDDYLDFLAIGKTELKNGKRVLMSTIAFRNEPYTGAGAQLPC